MRKGKPRKEQPPSRQEALAVFTFLRDNLGVLQREIAHGTGMDQGSVCKLLKGRFREVKGRAYRLWKYAKPLADKGGYEPGDAGLKPDERLAEKLNRVWDRTEEGAKALLKLLDAAEMMQKRRDRRAPGK